MKKFLKLCESLSTIKKTTTIRYPKQIQISEEFKAALKKEMSRIQSLIQESKQPIINFTEKFIKALRFHIVELSERKVPKSTQRDQKLAPIIKQLNILQSVRKPMPPPTKVLDKQGYDRKDKKWKRDVEN